MGREIKRVSLDFDWPLGMPWKGFINPYSNQNGEIYFNEKTKRLSNEWHENEKYEPPGGEGWQLWETVSEGSPISPVFGSPEELARWLTTNDKNSGDMDYESWLRFIKEKGWAMSGMFIDGKVMTGVEATSKI